MRNEPKHLVRLGGRFWVLSCYNCGAEWHQVHYKDIAKKVTHQHCLICGVRARTEFEETKKNKKEKD